jgi:hypothetical protein
MMSAPEAAAWIADRFDEDGIEYAIGGALALIAWGAPRATADVDISAFVERRDSKRVLGALERAGVMFPNDAANQIERMGFFRGQLGRIPIDVFISEHPHQHAMHERRQLLELTEGRPRWFVSPEDLVILKIFYGRAKDELDIERLLTIRPDLDLSYVEGWLKQMVPAGDRRFEMLARLRAR